MLVARIEGVLGGSLWKNNGENEGRKTLSNLEDDMIKGCRFKRLKTFIPYMWSDERKKNVGPWWQITRTSK